MVDIFQRYLGRLQAELNRARRKPGSMLDAIETFFFDGRNELAVFYEGGRSVAMIGINAQDNGVHIFSGRGDFYAPGLTGFTPRSRERADGHTELGRAL